MKRNFMLLLCIIALAVTCFVSCQEEHTHTFSSDWANDATSHWHAATCEHGEIKDSLASHVDANEDGACDVCAYDVKHSHTFESEWSFDDNNHWKSATCSHSNEKGEFSLHSDEDVDGSCDVCKGHVHNVNGAGYCSFVDCGKKIKEVDETDLSSLVNAVLCQQYLVNGGHISYDFQGPSNTSPDYVANKLDTVDYIFGKDDYTYIKVVTESVNAGVSGNGVYETWHQRTGPEDTFGVYLEDDLPLALDMSNVDKLRGYFIALSTLAGDYGAESTLYALYEAAIADSTDDLIVYPDTSENKITFKYSYKTVFVNTTDVTTETGKDVVHNVNFFEVQVTFNYSDDFALTGFEILVDCYTNDPGTADGYGFLEPDVDLDYDPDTDTVTLRENALPNTYTIVLTQTLGERTEENPNPKSKFIPESFDLYLGIDDETGDLLNKYEGADIEVEVRDIINLYVGTCYPSGTSLHFAPECVSFKLYKYDLSTDSYYEIENITDYMNEVAVAEFTFAGSQRSFFVIPKEEGLFKFEISLFDSIVYEISIRVGFVEEKVELGENQFAVNVRDTYEWSNEVVFTASDAGTYYFNIPAGIGFVNADAFDAAEETPATDDSPEPYFDFQQHGNENGGSFSVTLAAGESIRFYVSGAQRGTYVISYYVF